MIRLFIALLFSIFLCGFSPAGSPVSSPAGSPVPSVSAAATPDWPSWTGASDGAVTNLVTSGDTRAQDIAAVDDTEAVMVWNQSNTSYKAVVLDVDATGPNFKAETTNTAITLTTGAAATGINLVRLSGTKFLSLTVVSGGLRISLITKSGKTLVETDTLVDATYTWNFRHYATVLDATTVAYIGRDNGTTDGKMAIIDVTGDTITVGTPVGFGLGTIKDDVVDMPTVVKAGTGAFWAANQYVVAYCTYSGTTVTVQDTLDIDAGATVYDDVMGGYIDDDTMLLTYELVTGSTVNANTFSWSGSAISRGTAISDIFDGNDITTLAGTVTELGNRQVMFSATQRDETPMQSAQVVLSVNESNVITDNGRVITSASVQADHPAVDATPSGLYVFNVYQDEGTVPLKQIGTKILVAPTQ